MAVSLDKQITNAEKRATIATLKAREQTALAAYEQLKDGQKRARKQPAVEMQSEEELLTERGRLKSIAQTREMFRAFAQARALIVQYGLWVIGTGPKVSFHTDDVDWNRAAAHWFNSAHAKRCDARGNRHLADQQRVGLASVVRDGDILMHFDTVGIADAESKGRYWYWEADQITTITAADFKRHAKAIAKQLGVTGTVKQYQGLIVDQWGRVRGVIVTEKYGAMNVRYLPDARPGDKPANEATILDMRHTTLLSNPFRINQKRGITEFVATGACLRDGWELDQAFIARTKRQAKLAMKFTKEDPLGAAQARTDETDAPATVTLESDDTTSAQTHYNNFEVLADGASEYMLPGENAEAMQLSGDLVEFDQIAKHLGYQGAYAMGWPRLFALGVADASYSASRAEQNLAEQLVEVWQKWVERYDGDWRVDQAIRYAIATGALPANDQWEDNYSWGNWPRMRNLNPLSEEKARTEKLKNALTNYEKLLGPNWREIIDALGEQITYARDKGVFPEPWESSRQAAAATKQARDAGNGAL